MRRFITVGMTASVAAALVVVAGPGVGQPPAGAPAPAVTEAVAVLHPTKGHKVKGVVRFSQKGDQVEITGEIVGLSPGPHGFHVHEYGDCSAPDGKSAGGHFNPTNMPHAGPDAAKRHAGDLGNIQADESGRAVIRITDRVITLNGPHTILGRGLVVHAKADDLKSQPSGDAGDRVACGVIGVANPKGAAAKK